MQQRLVCTGIRHIRRITIEEKIGTEPEGRLERLCELHHLGRKKQQICAQSGNTQHDKQNRNDPFRTTDVKIAERKSPVIHAGPDHGRNQETGQHEKNVNPEKTAPEQVLPYEKGMFEQRKRNQIHMVKKNRDYGKRLKPSSSFRYCNIRPPKKLLS